MLLTAERTEGNTGPAAMGGDQLVWYFFRVSGILLIGLVGSHLFITHYLHAPSETTFDFVAKRYANPLWRTADWLLLLTALWHGLLGARIVVQDYVRPGGWRLAIISILYVIGAAFTLLGTVTILSFDEAAARNNTGPLAGSFWIGDALGYSLYVLAAITYVSIAGILIYALREISKGNLLFYRGDPGQYAFLLHRLTGIGIIGFLLVHIVDILLIGLGRDVYDHTVEFYSHWFIVPMEIALVGAVIYHGLNGLRITLIDFWKVGAARQRQMFIAVIIGAILLTLPSVIVILQHEL
ncbi:MAG TPA: succinate dehydrogenase, cytochrome b556 subunit [Thermomicrobiales bacterium]|mgnify:CR=1 FL=1|nr:succinate dehydrogenase, cytochrome b556 subunit [Thermomicrobiales bacterium]HRA46868.1 succinate dehydrogenase, cytochrome b556 subunit [Thermomicrobiales bacterium]